MFLPHKLCMSLHCSDAGTVQRQPCESPAFPQASAFLQRPQHASQPSAKCRGQQHSTHKKCVSIPYKYPVHRRAQGRGENKLKKRERPEEGDRKLRREKLKKRTEQGGAKTERKRRDSGKICREFWQRK